VTDPYLERLDALVLDTEIACAIVIVVLVYYSTRRDRFRHFVIGVFVGMLFGLLITHAIAP